MTYNNKTLNKINAIVSTNNLYVVIWSFSRVRDNRIYGGSNKQHQIAKHRKFRHKTRFTRDISWSYLKWRRRSEETSSRFTSLKNSRRDAML